MELGGMVRHHGPIGQLAGQFGLFVATVVLAGLVFRLTAPLRPADPRRRLARSEALRLAAVRPHECGFGGLPGRGIGQRRPAAWVRRTVREAIDRRSKPWMTACRSCGPAK